MAQTTIFCVQSYWKDRRRLNMGSFRQFSAEASAINHGERASRRQDGVIVYALDGDPDLDFWGEPRVLKTWGDTPIST